VTFLCWKFLNQVSTRYENCCLEDRYQSFWRTCSLLPWRWKNQFLLKVWCLPDSMPCHDPLLELQLLNQSFFHEIWILNLFYFKQKLNGWNVKGRTIPVSCCGGPWGYEMSRFPHFLDSRVRDCSVVVSHMLQLPLTPRKIRTHFCLSGNQHLSYIPTLFKFDKCLLKSLHLDDIS
jgi:hypothetical protein